MKSKNDCIALQMLTVIVTACATCLCGCVEGRLKICSEADASSDPTYPSIDYDKMLPEYESENSTNVLYYRRDYGDNIWRAEYFLRFDPSRVPEALGGSNLVVWNADKRPEPLYEFHFLTNIVSTLETVLGKTIQVSFSPEQFKEVRVATKYWEREIDSYLMDSAFKDEPLITVNDLIQWAEVLFPVHFLITSNRVEVSLRQDGKSSLDRMDEVYNEASGCDFFWHSRPQETVENP